MYRDNKLVIFAIGGALIVAAAVGMLLVGGTSAASAAAESWMPTGEIISTIDTEIGSEIDGFNHHGRWTKPGRAGGNVELLADALDISIEELEDALERAQLAAIDLALEEGLITQERADMMILRGLGYRGLAGGVKAVDMDALLAEELDISIEQLVEAREQAADAAIDQAVADGLMTPEQADMVRARAALRDYVRQDLLLSQALGLTVDDLHEAREEGKSISDILSEQGVTAVEVREALVAAHEAAIQQAVEDGVITQEQADQFLNGAHPMGGFRMPGFPGFRRGGMQHKDGFGFPQRDTPTESSSGL
ncbi:MAG: hypothetical protein U9R58_06040 [Chloroflexota bacterium]|nr:hypothetical protein [Chloroflexota bacterium]